MTQSDLSLKHKVSYPALVKRILGPAITDSTRKGYTIAAGP